MRKPIPSQVLEDTRITGFGSKLEDTESQKDEKIVNKTIESEPVVSEKKETNEIKLKIEDKKMDQNESKFQLAESIDVIIVVKFVVKNLSTLICQN